MKIKILLGDKGNVDFNSPIKLLPDEKDKFIQLIENIFDVVELDNIEDFRDWRMGGNRIQYPRKWTPKEYETLLKSHNLYDAISKLGRSGMAIIVQDGKWRPEFFEWCHKNDKNPFEGDMSQIIKEFLEYKRILREKKHQERKNNKSNEIENDVTKVMKCPSCGRSVRGIVINDNEARCGSCGKEFSITKDDIEKEEELDKNG